MSIRTIHALGVRLTISSDVDELLEQFLTVFCAFIGTASPDDGNTDITVMIRDAEGLYDDGRRKVRLAPGRWRAPHVYNLLYTTLVRAFDTVYLLHAAVVAGDGRAWLIGGPSGSGKSSLCRALIDRGYELLSDDLAPLSLADGLVHPFPRRLGLVRDVGRPDPAAALRLGEKLFVTAEQMGLRMATVALPPGGVVLMNPYDPGGSTVEITLGLVGDPAALRARLIAEPGVVLSRSRTEGDLSELTLVVQGASAIAHLERELERADDELLFHFRSYGSDKTYAATPALRPITVREATFGLLQEMLNREPGSALMRRLRRKASGAVIELMGALGGVPCFQLEPSGIESTAALLARTFKALKQVGDRPAPP